MDNALIWIIVVAVASAGGYFSYRIAARKGRNALAFGLLGFFLPLVGVAVALVLSPRTAEVEGISQKESATIGELSAAIAEESGTTS